MMSILASEEPNYSVLQANAQLAQKGALESEVQRFNTHRGNILLLEYFVFI